MKSPIGSKALAVIGLSAIVASCSEDHSGKFELIDPSSSGLEFTNEVPENDSLNQFTYHYLYNGNGVGIGDLDNDGLPEVFVSSNASSCQLFHNKGHMQFENITESAGVSSTEWCTGVSMADINNDGLLDIYVCRSGPSQNPDKKRNLLFINQGNLKFKEEAKRYGLDDPGNATTASFLDFDRDGDLDLYVANHADRFFSDVDIRFSKTFRLDANSQQHLYRNDGQSFTDISEEAGVKAMGYALSATVFDINGDGWDDIYVCNDYHVPDYVLINNQQGGFSDENAQRFKHTSNNSMGSDQADINNDGKLDFLSVDMLADNQRRFMTMGGPKDYDYTMVGIKNGYGYQYMKNALQINHGKGLFSDEAYLYGIARTDWSWSPLFVDFDADGYLDLHITNGYYRDVTDQDFMLYQNRKMQQQGAGITHEELLSMLPFEKISNYAYRNNNGKGFSAVTEDWGLEEPSLSTGSAYGDLDGDGDADLIICNQGSPLSLYRNNLNSSPAQIKVRFNLSNSNRMGYGTQVEVHRGSEIQRMELNSAHGYQSSSQACLFVATSGVDSLVFHFPNGTQWSSAELPAAGKEWVVDDKQSVPERLGSSESGSWFTAAELGLDFLHREQENPDFKREPMLPHRFTRLGPGMCSGDINGDGLEDIFIANARTGNPNLAPEAAFFLQSSNGQFRKQSAQPLLRGMDTDITGCLLFDANGDGHLDLYVAAGGSEYSWPSALYSHRLYINNGSGSFKEESQRLPQVQNSGSCVVAGDIDGDGDWDLFVGGRVMPGFYPQIDIRSYLLRNNNGQFQDVTAEMAPELVKAGMICTAAFADCNNDNQVDLLVAGEYTPLVLLLNKGQKFENATASWGLDQKSGWINSLLPVDIDNDGDLDVVVGNKGRNSFIQANPEEPLKVYYTDLDNNGSMDVFFGKVRQGKEYTLYQLEDMARAYPGFMNKRFTTYKDIANKDITDIFGEENLQRYQLANFFDHFVAINEGNRFRIESLPWECQSGPVYGLAAFDVNADGFEDILAIGNNASTRVQHGKDDALNGFILWNQQEQPAQWSFENGVDCGFYVPGDGRSLLVVPGSNGPVYVASQNDSRVLGFQSKSVKTRFERAPKGAQFAWAYLTSGGRKRIPLSLGYGYLSGSTPGVWLNPSIQKVEFIDARGKMLDSIEN